MLLRRKHAVTVRHKHSRWYHCKNTLNLATLSLLIFLATLTTYYYIFINDITQNDDKLFNYGEFKEVSSAKKGARCYRQVNIPSFYHNVKAIQKMAKATGCKMIAVVKADAYGHGAIRLGHECLKFGIKTFAVATVLEGIELRTSSNDMMNKNIKIIVLGPTIIDEYELISRFSLDIMLSSFEMTHSLIDWAKNIRSDTDKKNIIHLHCMIDTGMTRIGFQADECMKAIELIQKTVKKLGLKFIGLCTHFSDVPNTEYTLLQFDRFTSVLTKLNKSEINVEMFHFENSKSLMMDAIEDDLVKSYMDHDTKGYTRTGGALYGREKMIQLMSLYGQIRNIQPIKKGTPVGYNRSFVAEENVLIATLAIGYGDGYPRGMSNAKKSVRINNYLYDIAGEVCMDMTMVNLGNIDKNQHIKDIKIGDYAVLFGSKEDHMNNIQLEDMCKLIGGQYNEWDITCGLTKRCPIVYKD